MHMNKKIVIILAVFMVGSLKAASEQELFLRGNDYYGKHEYVSALNAYEAMQNKGRSVWYNMGNCAYKIGNKPQALAYWKRSQQGAHAHELADIQYNIHVLEKEYETHTEKYFWQRLYSVISEAATPYSLTMLQMVFLAVWFLLLYVWKKYGYKNFWLLLGVLAINILCAALLIVKYSTMHQRVGIVTGNQVALYAGPNEQYHTLGLVDEMAQVLVQEQRNSWCKVNYAQLTGWVPSDKILVV
jgi:hypothetical protein